MSYWWAEVCREGEQLSIILYQALKETGIADLDFFPCSFSAKVLVQLNKRALPFIREVI